jgi:NADH dehydrogenase
MNREETSMESKRILIVGGGFAGVNAAAGAVDTLGAAQHRIPVELVSPSPAWVIKPRLYESDLAGVRVPLAGVLDPLGVVHHQARVTTIDTAERRVALDDGSELRYGQLVLAAGSRLALPEGRAVYCVDSYEQALELRRAIDALLDRERRPRAVVVGAGFTGIEVASELARDADVTVVAFPELAPGYGPSGRAQISEALESLSVEVRSGSRVREVSDGSVYLSDGEVISADVVVWATGPHASALTEQVPGERDGTGRLLVDQHLRTVAPGVWAAGDTACAMVDPTNSSVMSCQHAGPTGRRAGENAAAVALGRAPKRYRQPLYLTCLALGDYGALLTCGFDRDTILATKKEGAALKHAINHGAIYPPRGGDRKAMLKIGKPAQPGPLGAKIARTALRSRWVRRKIATATPVRSDAYAADRSSVPIALR